LLDSDISIAAATPMEEGGAMRILDTDTIGFIGRHIVATRFMLAANDDR
jgi:hypothetical protein